MTDNLIEIRNTTLETCSGATGIVVVIDVLRAFTTSAFAFYRGAREITLVATTEQAFELRHHDPELLLMGEVNGRPVDGFDLPNSPAAIDNTDLRARRLVMRTTAGTQGVVLASRASHLYVASLCVATATANRIKALDPGVVSFIETGRRAKGGGEEDSACADLIASQLLDAPIPIASIQGRVRESKAAAKFCNPHSTDFPGADLERALEVDRFQFAMQVQREGDLLVLRANEVIG